MIEPIAINNLFGIEGLNIHWYGIFICTGIVLGVLVGIKLAKKKGYNSDMVIDLILLALPISIVCARLYYVAFEWSMFADDLSRIFRIWEGGLGIYGAVIGAVIACLIFAKWKKIRLGDILDIGAPPLILGQAIGRWGNFVNQEAFGNAVTDPALQWFPYAVNITQDTAKYFDDALQQWVPAQGWFQATFFYESMWNFLVFGALMFYFKKAKCRGNVFVMYLILYGIGRFFIEGMRTDSLWMIPGVIRVSQMLSAILVIGGIIYLLWRRKKADTPYEYVGKYSLGYVKPTGKDKDADVKAKEASEVNEDEAAEIKAEDIKADTEIKEDIDGKSEETAEVSSEKEEENTEKSE